MSKVRKPYPWTQPERQKPVVAETTPVRCRDGNCTWEGIVAELSCDVNDMTMHCPRCNSPAWEYVS